MKTVVVACFHGGSHASKKSKSPNGNSEYLLKDPAHDYGYLSNIFEDDSEIASTHLLEIKKEYYKHIETLKIIIEELLLIPISANPELNFLNLR